MSRKIRTVSAFLLFAGLSVLDPTQARSAGQVLALQEGWEAHPITVLRPEGGEKAFFDSVGFDQEGESLFVAQVHPMEQRSWSIRDRAWTITTDDKAISMLLSRRPCIGLSPHAHRPDGSADVQTLATFSCPRPPSTVTTV